MKLEEVKLNNIHLVSVDQVYEWVKAGQWSKRDFGNWISTREYEIRERTLSSVRSSFGE